MDLNKIQSVLESLPDQDIAKYAQQPSPQVPQVLAQMELQRRATLRKAAQMQNKGGIGMAAGGAVKGYSEGGGILGYLGELTGSMSKKMREVRAEKERKDALRAKEPPRDNLDGTLLGMGRDLIGSTDDFTARKNAALGSLAPAPSVEKQKPAAPAAPAAPAQKGASGSWGDPATQTPPAPALEQAPPPNLQSPPAGDLPSRMPQAEAPVTNAGPAAVTPMPKPLDPNADPRMAQMEAALKLKGDVIAKAVSDELSLRRSAMVPVDEEKERNRRLYRALGQWGSALILSRSYGVANATAINTLQNELAKSEEKREAFKKASLDTALTEIKYRIEQAGAPVDNLKALEALRANIMKENLELREQDRKERDTASDISYKGFLGPAAATNAKANIISAERPRTGDAPKEMSYEQAKKQALDELESDKFGLNRSLKGLARDQHLDRRARQIIAGEQQLRRDIASGKIDALAKSYPGAPTIPEGVKVTQVKP